MINKRWGYFIKNACVLLSILAGVSICFLWVQFRKISINEQNFSKAIKGASKVEILSLMGNPTATNQSATEFWNDAKLENQETNQIVETLDYRVSTFFLPVTFRFSFDANSKLVAKHRYD